MQLEELISMNIGDRVFNCGNVWKLDSIDRKYEPDTTRFNFIMVVNSDYRFTIQLNRSWKTPIYFIYDYENIEYVNNLDPKLEDTTLYSKQEHIKIYRKKINDKYKEIFYYTNKIIELESE
jgi:hypothetical protein